MMHKLRYYILSQRPQLLNMHFCSICGVYTEGERGRQQSTFSTTNDSGLASSTTTSAQAQTGMLHKLDRQACSCLLIENT